MQHVQLVAVPRWEGSGEGAAVWVAPVEKPRSQQGSVAVPG